MGVCKHCGASLNSNEELCNSCKSKQMTINKMYDFYNKMLNAEKHLC